MNHKRRVMASGVEPFDRYGSPTAEHNARSRRTRRAPKNFAWKDLVGLYFGRSTAIAAEYVPTRLRRVAIVPMN